MERNHPKRDRLLMRLLDGARYGEIARELSVTYETVRQWKADPDVQADLNTMRDERMTNARELGKAATEEAVRVLYELLEHDDPDVRIKAANSLLDRFGAPKTSKVEATIEEPTVTSDELRSKLTLALSRAQGGQPGGSQ